MQILPDPVKPILEIQNISKKYRIRHLSGSYLSLRERMLSIFKFERTETEDLWALNDVSFEVRAGESIGIIGKNGAGKSTLLKILSKITPPTRGRIISRGRIASLLEVGTGFHQELTGRENIFMNGSILGMKRNEIAQKFDEIVEFSGIEKFLDTQLKHYSSGMQLRLAFSVAANLEPEILIIDEVLAVGDSTFQKKCMQKMSEVAGAGRTILFVSHNMQAVKALCSNSLILQSGKVIMQGPTDQVVDHYLAEDNLENQTTFDIKSLPRSAGQRGLIFEQLKFSRPAFRPGDPLSIRLKLGSDGQQYKDLLFGVNIYDSSGNCLIHLSNIFLHQVGITHSDAQIYQFTVAALNLKPGRYTVSLFVRSNEEIQDWLDKVAVFEVEEGNIYGFENSQMIQGILQPEFSFEQLYE